jgi:hypothetical protein
LFQTYREASALRGVQSAASTMASIVNRVITKIS